MCPDSRYLKSSDESGAKDAEEYHKQAIQDVNKMNKAAMDEQARMAAMKDHVDEVPL